METNNIIETGQGTVIMNGGNPLEGCPQTEEIIKSLSKIEEIIKDIIKTNNKLTTQEISTLNYISVLKHRLKD
jgi:hypothetical protein